MKRYLSLFFLLISPIFLMAQDVESVFQEANKHFEAGSFTKAINLYKTIEDQAYLSPELFLNMGNAYFRNEDVARSVLYFERGLKYFPNDHQLSANLEIAKNKVETEIFEVEDFILVRLWNSFSRIFSSPVWAGIQILLLGALVFGLYLWLFKSELDVRRRGFIILTGCALLFLISFFAGQTAYKSKFSQKDGIIVQSISLKEGPDERSGEVKALNTGIKFKIVDQIGEWYKIQLLNQQQGWVVKSQVEII